MSMPLAARPSMLQRGATALKVLLLGGMVLWYGLLPVALIEDMARLRQEPVPAVATGLAVFLLSGLMAARLFKRAWIGLSIAAATFFLLELVRSAAWREGLPAVLGIGAVLLLWIGVGTAAALVWRRGFDRLLLHRQRLGAVAATAAGLAVGLFVVLHPRLLWPLIGLIYSAWKPESPFPSDLEIALYYMLGGLAVGFTWRLLWPRSPGVPRTAILVATAIWCALACSTLLDADDSPQWAYPAANVAPPLIVLLAMVAASLPAGLWLARWPARWSSVDA